MTDRIDRSTCLFLTGVDGVSAGAYHPFGYELRLSGAVKAQHQFTHLHEIHHKLLNDDTSWGTALHVCARHPSWDETLFPPLLSVCRTTHEVFASFLSLSLLRSRHPDADDVLQDYPAYAIFAGRMQRLLDPVPPGHRQDLAATGVARFCMGAPVPRRMIEAYPAPLRLADLRSRDHPDHRLARLLDRSAADVRRAVRVADEAFGGDVDELALSATDAALDQAWRRWEDAFNADLVGSDRTLTAYAVVNEVEQLRDALELGALLGSDGIEIDLPKVDEDGPISDVESVQRLLNAIRLPLRTVPWRGALAELGVELGTAELLALVETTTGGRSDLVLQVRPADGLATLFDFSAGDRRRLDARGVQPVMAVRAPIDYDDGELMLQVAIPTPAAFTDLADATPSRAIVASCLSASCFLASDWQSAWWPVLRRHPTVVLVDCGLRYLAGPDRLLGDTQTVWGRYLSFGHPVLGGLLWHVDGHPHVMLALGDDLTIQLLAGQLRDVLGDRLRMQDSDWSQWDATLKAVVSSLLGTENVIRFDGLERR